MDEGEGMIHFQENKYGFEWGGARIIRTASDEKKGWVLLRIETPKYKGDKAWQIYVTKTGKIRIFTDKGELVKEKKDE